MEVRIEARPALNISHLRDFLLNETAAKKQTEMPSSAVLVKNIEAVYAGNAALDRSTVSEQLAELLSIFDREVKFEILEDVGVVQIQVIDTRDGSVVRKIPLDEVIRFMEFVKNLKERTDDGVDVRT